MAGFAELEFVVEFVVEFAALAPTATVADMEGLDLVTKLPQISVMRSQSRSLCCFLGGRIALTHERELKVRSLVHSGGAKIPRHVRAVCGSSNGVLVFVRAPALVGESFSHPVARADEGGLGVDVVCTLLLASGDVALI